MIEGVTFFYFCLVFFSCYAGSATRTDCPGAIRLCLNCQEASRRHDQFGCIISPSPKKESTWLFDGVLPDLTGNCFSNSKNPTVDQCLMHFANVIHNTSFNIVLGTVELYNPPSPLNTSTNNASFSFQHVHQQRVFFVLRSLSPPKTIQTYSFAHL